MNETVELGQGIGDAFPRWRALYERAGHVLAGGVSSQFRAFNVPHPMFYERASGSRIYVSAAHSAEDIQTTLATAEAVLMDMAGH